MRSVREWSNKEIAKLKEIYPSGSWEEILSTFSERTKNQIITKARELRIFRERKSFNKLEWTDEEIEILKCVYLNTKIDDIPKLYLPNKTKSTVVRKMSELKLLKSRPWTPLEVEKFIELYPTTDNNELVKIFGRTKMAIINESQKLELYKGNHFTKDDIEYIKANYLTMTDREMAKALEHPWRVVKDKRLRLGLKHQDAVIGTQFRDLAELLRKRTEQWRKDSMKYCNYKCVITGENFDVVHHLYSANMIIEEVLEGYDIPKNVDPYSLSEELIKELAQKFLEAQYKYGLGVCLTSEIHKQFHFEYGYGNNMPEQFVDFCNKHNYKLLVNI